MRKKFGIAFAVLIVLIICIAGTLIITHNNQEVLTVKSEKQLLKLYEGTAYSSSNDTLISILTTPFSFFNRPYRYYETKSQINYDLDIMDSIDAADTLTTGINELATSGTTTEAKSKDYSTTNIQVENVDEADIIKTDGDYIYSISENNVIITNVKNPEEVKIEAIIKGVNSQSAPEEIILCDNKLVVINTKVSNKYYYSNNNNTVVSIYDITDKANPYLVKSFELYEPYYTSRCIDNELYVIASGNLRKDNNKIVKTYQENNYNKEIELNNIHYLKDINTTKQTIISSINLNNVSANINVSSYLIDISNAYVSENSIYLLDQKYDGRYSSSPRIRDMFGLKGVFGLFADRDYDEDYGYKTEIYKFNINKNGEVKYATKNKIKGQTINQYSLDEKDGHLRIALYDNDGARIVIFNEKLKQIGISQYVAEGERMYSSRFMGDKAYLVTYRNTDPLFVFDLSNETNPQVLGELHIPGYSTYLHPYDENHLIGIGMETKEVVNRDYSGRIRSTTARIVGMKMALFDVSDVNHPKQISQTVIGDSRTTSAILTNPKALLFSKEKQLIAIPVNNYDEDFEVSDVSDSIDSMVSSYSRYNKSRVGEGYFVYNINLDDGFSLKGVVTHDTPKRDQNYYYYLDSKLLRGLYIEDNLYTVSESAVKVNSLDTLELISELNIK